MVYIFITITMYLLCYSILIYSVWSIDIRTRVWDDHFFRGRLFLFGNRNFMTFWAIMWLHSGRSQGSVRAACPTPSLQRDISQCTILRENVLKNTTKYLKETNLFTFIQEQIWTLHSKKRKNCHRSIND